MLQKGELSCEADSENKSIQSQIENRELWGSLTGRELEVLRLLARGLTNREIASALNISSSTIKNYVKNILTKLDVSGRTEAVSLCLSRIFSWQKIYEPETKQTFPSPLSIVRMGYARTPEIGLLSLPQVERELSVR